MRRAGQLDLNEAVQHPGKKLKFQVSTELANEADLDLVEPVQGELEAVSTGNILLVTARLNTRAVLECARCASPIEADVSFKMNDEFAVEGIPSAYASDGYAEVVSDEPDKIFDKNALVLDAYVRQGLLLNLPDQLLCSGTWDTPCPGETEIKDVQQHGHPGLQALQTLVSSEDE